MVDAGVRDYLWEIAKLVDNAGGAPADKDMLLANTFEEFAGQEVKVMLDSRCGPALETFIPILNVELTNKLLTAVNTAAIDICADKSASRILEKLLTRVGEHIKARVPEADGLKDGLIALSDALEKESWADAICDPNGTHVTRTLIHTLAVDPRDAKLRNALHSTCAGIISGIGDNMSEAIVHTYANPVLQAVVEALSMNKPFVKLVVDRIISAIEDEQSDNNNNNNDEESKESEINSKNNKIIYISCHPIGSRLVETILENSSDSIYATLYTKWFRGILQELARDKIGNHIVQKLLSSQYCQAPQATMIVKEFLPTLKEFLKSRNNEGVVMQIADACVNHEVCQKEFYEALQNALCEEESDEKPQKEEEEEEEEEKPVDKKEKKNIALELLKSPNPNYIRSRIAQSLFKMDKFVSRQFCEALFSLGSVFLVQLAEDKSGSRVVEAGIESRTLPIQNHLKIFEAYIGSFAQLAMSPCASHIVEKLYFAADMKNKEKIAQELMENEQKLAVDRIGKFILRTCKVRLYREKKEIWKSGVSKNTKKREMFDDILNDGEGDDAKKKGDKKKAEEAKKSSDDKVSPHMKDDYESFMEKLGFGSKKSKSEKSEEMVVEKKKTEKEEGATEKVDSKDIDSLNQSVIDVLMGTKKKSKKKKKHADSENGEEGEKEEEKKKSKKRENPDADSDEKKPAKKKSKKEE